MNTHYYLQGAEPFYFNGNGTGCLLVHGFTSSPGEMRWLGQHLHEQGLTVHGVRLAGHGADHRHMAHVRWPDWYGNVLDGYHLLRQTCERVFIIGHSMGGLLAVLAGASLPVDGLVILAAPLIFKARFIRLAFLIRYVRRYIDATDHSGLPQRVREEQSRRGEPVLGRVRYNIWSTAAIAQLHALAKETRSRLPHITTPACLVYSTADNTAAYENMQLIASGIRSTVVEQHTLHSSDHNLMLDEEKTAVFQLTWNFIQSMKA